MNFDVEHVVMMFMLMVVAITIHEFAHAISADRLGDPTPRKDGRISLNPIDHLDPVGTVLMLLSVAFGIGFGWGKPVMTDPRNFKRPVVDTMIVAACGPLSNFLQALVFAGAIHLNYAHGWWTDGSATDALMQMGVQVNLWLMLFNLIPVPPLDGSKVLYALLSADMAERYARAMNAFGPILFAIVICTGAASYLLWPEVSAIFHFLADQR